MRELHHPLAVPLLAVAATQFALAVQPVGNSLIGAVGGRIDAQAFRIAAEQDNKPAAVAGLRSRAAQVEESAADHGMRSMTAQVVEPAAADVRKKAAAHVVEAAAGQDMRLYSRMVAGPHKDSGNCMTFCECQVQRVLKCC